MAVPPSPTVTTTAPPTNTMKGDTINLKLEYNPDPKSRPSHPRTLLLAQDHLIAYGGMSGTLTALPTNSSPSTEPHVIHESDDPIRALAFSPDGLRVAVGYENGDIDIYTYEPTDLDASPTHPFLSSKSTTGDTSQSPISQEDFFTQDEEASPGPTFRIRTGELAPVRYLSFDPRSRPTKYYLAVATEAAPGFRILNVERESTPTSSEIYLKDEAEQAYDSGGVRSLQYSPDGCVLATLGMDGRVCLWDVSSLDDPLLDWDLMHRDGFKAVSKGDVGELLGADVADRSLCPTWDGKGRVLGIPGEAYLQFRREAQLKFSRKTEEKSREWLGRNLLVTSLGKKESEIVSMAFDPTEEGYVVTCTRDGKISLWQIYPKDTADDETDGKLIADITHNDAICTCALWYQDPNTKSETLYLAFENASMLVVRGRDEIINVAKRNSETENRTRAADDEAKEGLVDDSQDDFNTQPLEEEIPAVVQKKRLQKKKRGVGRGEKEEDDDDLVFDNGLDANDGDGDGDMDTTLKTNPFIADEVDVDDDADFAADSQFDDVIKSQKDEVAIVETTTPQAEDDLLPIPDDELSFHNIDDDDTPPTTTTSLPEPQAAFAPSSTPISPHRILCWNHIGVISSRNDGPVNAIDISFTDSTSHRPVSFRDNMNFILGSLGAEGGLFASDVMDEDEEDEHVRSALDGLNGISDATKSVVKKSEKKRGDGGATSTGSCIYFHRFETFGPIKDKDWHLTLPSGERVLGCASGEGWAAVVTSRNFLRTFTSGGLQGPIIWLKGAPVTITGLGRSVAVFYHECNPLMDGTQKLGYSFYDGVTGKEIASGSVAAISPKASLTWVGFSTDDSLCVMDSDGMLSTLIPMKPDGVARDISWVWVPMLDTLGLKKSSADTFWPISVQDAKLICVPLRGDVQHPDPMRRPVTAALPLRMPLARSGGGTNFTLEEVSIRANIALEQKKYQDEYTIATEGNQYADNLELEYKGLCARVDKVTLKLYFSFAKSGKLERALDVTHRLRLEKSFDIAIKAADQLNHRTLSDRIHELQEDKFCSLQEEEYSEDEENTFHQSEDETSYADTHRVSPDAQNTRSKRKGTELNTQARHVKPRALEVEQDHFEEPKRKRHNPFAKTRKESPAKTSAPQSPIKKSPGLSRMSTFSTQSRLRSKVAKEII